MFLIQTQSLREEDKYTVLNPFIKFGAYLCVHGYFFKQNVFLFFY